MSEPSTIPAMYQSVRNEIHHWLANVATDQYKFSLKFLDESISVTLTRSIHVFPDKTWCYMATDEQNRSMRGHINYPADVTPAEVVEQMPKHGLSDLMQGDL